MTDPGFKLRTNESGIPVTGTPGNVLTFQADGTTVAGEPAPSGGGVTSVNGDTGPAVVLTAADVGAVASVNGDTGPAVVLTAADVGAATPADVAAAIPQTTHAKELFFGQINSAGGTGGNVNPGDTVEVVLNTGEGPAPFTDGGTNAIIGGWISGNPGAHTMVPLGWAVNDIGVISVFMLNAGLAIDNWNNIPFYCLYEKA